MRHAKDKEQLFLKEIDVVQNQIARYDDNGLKIKEWCITVWAGLIAYGFAQREWVIVLSALVTTLTFSFIEFTYRRFQWRFIMRSKVLEELLTSEGIKDYVYGVHRSAVGKKEDLKEEMQAVLKMPHFALFYISLIALAVATSCYTKSINQSRSSETVPRVAVSGSITNFSVSVPSVNGGH